MVSRAVLRRGANGKAPDLRARNRVACARHLCRCSCVEHKWDGLIKYEQERCSAASIKGTTRTLPAQMAFVIEDESGSYGSESSFGNRSEASDYRSPPQSRQTTILSAPKASAGDYDFEIEDEEASTELSPPPKQPRQKTPVQVRKQTSVVVPSHVGRAAAVDSKEKAAAMLSAAAFNSRSSMHRQ